MCARWPRPSSGPEVKPELEVFDSGDIHLANDLIAEGLIPGRPFFQIVTGVKYGCSSTVETLAYMKSILSPGAIWSAFGIGAREYPMLAAAHLLGGQVRVGMEDNIYIRRGRAGPRQRRAGGPGGDGCSICSAPSRPARPRRAPCSTCRPAERRRHAGRSSQTSPGGAIGRGPPRTTAGPLPRALEPDLTLVDAYAVQEDWIAARIAGEGRRPVGYKAALTTRGTQQAFGADEAGLWRAARRHGVSRGRPHPARPVRRPARRDGAGLRHGQAAGGVLQRG